RAYRDERTCSRADLAVSSAGRGLCEKYRDLAYLLRLWDPLSSLVVTSGKGKPGERCNTHPPPSERMPNHRRPQEWLLRACRCGGSNSAFDGRIRLSAPPLGPSTTSPPSAGGLASDPREGASSRCCVRPPVPPCASGGGFPAIICGRVCRAD